MNMESYFNHLSPDDIRIKGTRIGIESVLYEYIYREQPPESIVRRFPSLTLEQIYATILYYFQNKEKIGLYLKEWLEYGRQMREAQDRQPPPVVLRLRNMKQKQLKAA